MSEKIDVIWPIPPHTQAKHEILRHYLGAWFPILATTQRRLLYIDGFAGPGEYKGGEDGSPIIALKLAKDHKLSSKLQRPGMELVFFFIEVNEARFQNLERKLAELQLPSNFRVVKYCESFENAFGSTLAEIEEHLAKKAFATSEQEALHQLEGELAKLDYDSQQHEQVRHHLTSLEQYETPKRKLEEANKLISQEREALSRAEQAAQELHHSLESDNQKRQELTVELSSLPQISSDFAKAETEHQALSTQQRQAQEIVGSVKGKLQRCSELEIRRKEKEKLLSQTSKEERIYRDLAQAFGKSGVQLLLIETAIPEIQAEANKLLGRMTDNRMHVKIETQRETKKGDLLETLDIKISDELGIRNYEMFSGGEAFRINFAIRIALSKLLAKRAGTPLRTLIIDEGFGTQDSTGLEKLREAITSIQDDFDKIIVITHIEEFRDAFPNRIDVIKTAEGSTLEVS